MRAGRCDRLLGTLAVAALTALACGDNGTEPRPGPASVAVTSPIDTILALARNAQLAAMARDQAGSPVTAQFTWATSDGAVVMVNAAGLATAQGIGTATVTATTSGAVSGGLHLRVVAADLGTVGMLAGDALAAALVAGLSGGARSTVQTALGACGSGASTGNVVAVKTCADIVRAQTASATDPTDRALLAVLALYADQIGRLLAL